jgi:hypothetical protein
MHRKLIPLVCSLIPSHHSFRTRAPIKISHDRRPQCRTLRFFGHSDGYGYPGHVQTAYPIQEPLGVFNEVALQNYDYVLAQCAAVRNPLEIATNAG